MPSTLPAVLLSGGAVIDLDGSLLIQLAIFFAAFFLLRHLVFRPMTALFDAREAAIDGAKREARSIETDAEDKLKAFESEMKKVTWPDVGQVRQLSIGVIVLALFIGAVIWLMDLFLQQVLVRGIPSLFGS